MIRAFCALVQACETPGLVVRFRLINFEPGGPLDILPAAFSIACFRLAAFVCSAIISGLAPAAALQYEADRRSRGYGKLKDRCSLATGEQRHQYFPSIRKFQCIVVPSGEVRVGVTKSRHAEASALSPYPSVIEPDVFIESQFGAR